jgi:hypothetical protein
VSVTPADTERLNQLLRELEDLNIAEKFVDAAIQTETRFAGHKLLDAIKPETMRLGSAFAKAFIALRLANTGYDAFIEEVDATVASVESLRLHINGLSDPRDTSGNYPWGLRAFADAGFIPKSQAPQAI